MSIHRDVFMAIAITVLTGGLAPGGHRVKHQPASVDAPYLRRFTDEWARDLS